MGILDFLVGGGGQPGLLGGLFGQQPQKPQYDWQQPEAAPGFLGGLRNRKYEMAGYLSGALMPGSTQERIARGMQGMTQGAMTDIQSQMRLDALNAKRQQDAARAGVANDLPVSPALKRLFSQDEKIAQEAVKNMLYPNLMNVEGNILSPTMGGGARVIGSAPMSDKAEFAQPDGSMRPGYTIRPNLSNPSGGMVQMGGAPPVQQGAGAGNPAMPQMAGMQQPGDPVLTKLGPEQQNRLEKFGSGVGQDLAVTKQHASDAADVLRKSDRLQAILKRAENLGAIGPVTGSWAGQTLNSAASFLPGQIGKSAGAARSVQQELQSALADYMLSVAQAKLKGQGSVSESERKTILDTVGSMSTLDAATLRSIIDNGTGDARDVISRAHRVGVLDKSGAGISNVPTAADPLAAAPAGPAPSAPKRGDVQKGYLFLGGDPSKPENWKKVNR